jgi:hypothetical protein
MFAKELTIEPAKGRALDRHGDLLGIRRGRWLVFKERDRPYRTRLLRALSSPMGLRKIKEEAEDQCFGVRDVFVSQRIGYVCVTLKHRWWSKRWRKQNCSLVRKHLRENVVSPGVFLEVKW